MDIAVECVEHGTGKIHWSDKHVAWMCHSVRCAILTGPRTIVARLMKRLKEV